MSKVAARYRELVAAGELRPDPDQERAAVALDGLAQALEQQPRNGGGFFSRLLGSKADAPRGIYMWGGVGRGKSMLMDLAFDTIDFAPKRRIHFHEFMMD